MPEPAKDTPQDSPKPSQDPPKLTIHGVVAEGEPLDAATIVKINEAAKGIRKNRTYIAYKNEVRIGGTLAWRANNPGNLRGAANEIAKVPGAKGYFAVFPTLAEGEKAQRALYLDHYGTWMVKEAIKKLTPSSENNTEKYISDLKKQGVDMEKDVKSQIDLVMRAVKVNEGSGAGIIVQRGKTQTPDKKS